MTYEPLKWDVRSQLTSEDLRLQLVKKILDRMTDKELRSALHQYVYLQFHGMSTQELRLEFKLRGIEED